MDRMRCFELRDVGSIPAGPASTSPSRQIGKVVSLKRRNVVSSNLTRGTKLCRWNQLDRYWIANPWKQVRFLSPTPDNLTLLRVIKMRCCRKFIADVEFIYEMKKQTPLGDH